MERDESDTSNLYVLPLTKVSSFCVSPSIAYTLSGGGVPGLDTEVTTKVSVGVFSSPTNEYTPSVYPEPGSSIFPLRIVVIFTKLLVVIPKVESTGIISDPIPTSSVVVVLNMNSSYGSTATVVNPIIGIVSTTYTNSEDSGSKDPALKEFPIEILEVDATAIIVSETPVVDAILVVVTNWSTKSKDTVVNPTIGTFTSWISSNSPKLSTNVMEFPIETPEIEFRGIIVLPIPISCATFVENISTLNSKSEVPVPIPVINAYSK